MALPDEHDTLRSGELMTYPDNQNDTTPITVDTEGNVIDLDAIQDALRDNDVESSANIVPTEQTSTDVAVPSAPLRFTYTTTIPARIKDSFRDGEGIIISLAVGSAGLVIATSILFVQWVQMVGATIAANSSAILTAVAVVLIILLLLGLKGGKRGSKSLVLKGCPKGPTPGAHRVRIGG